MMIEPKNSISLKGIQQLFIVNRILADEVTINSVLNTLDLSFYTGAMAATYKKQSFIERAENNVSLSPLYKKALVNEYFMYLLTDILATGLLKSEEYSTSEPLTCYQKYKRKEVLRLLNWDKQMVDQNVGGYTSSKDEFVIFVTLKKGENFSGAQMAYEDELIDYSTMKWFTKSPRTMSSPEVQKLMEAEKWHIRIFAKKSDNEVTEFYYLGEVKPVKESIIELEKPLQNGEKKKVVEMFLKFSEPIDVNLFRYLVNIEANMYRLLVGTPYDLCLGAFDYMYKRWILKKRSNDSSFETAFFNTKTFKKYIAYNAILMYYRYDGG